MIARILLRQIDRYVEYWFHEVSLNSTCHGAAAPSTVMRNGMPPLPHHAASRNRSWKKIDLYHTPTPYDLKLKLFFEETGLPSRIVPVARMEMHDA